MDELVGQALQGTARGGDGMPTLGAPLDALLAPLAGLPAQTRLLLAAGAWAVYRQAGQPVAPVPELPAQAAEERLPECSVTGARLLERLLGEERADEALPAPPGRGSRKPARPEHAELLQEALMLLARAGRRLPYRLLPAALGLRPAELRAALLPTLGERGRWLARFNPEWAWAAGAAAGETDLAALEAAWQEGAAEARLAALRRARELDPASARAWAAATWRGEKAELRAEVVKALAAGLSAADEPFLEAALDDRGAAVRQEAARHLARLPGSALAARMRERADRLLDAAWTPALSGQLRAPGGRAAKSLRLSVTPPQAIDRSWERDGVVATPPVGAGERAWWLAQVLAAVPPEHWQRRFEATPAELVAAARDGEWEAVLLWGWTGAAVSHRAAAWAGPLLERWWSSEVNVLWAPPSAFHSGLVAELTGLLPGGVMERAAEDRLADGAPGGSRALVALLEHMPRPWSEHFGQRYLHHLRAQAERVAAAPERLESEKLPAPDLAALALPPACFAEALRPWPLPEPVSGPTQPWHYFFEAFTATVDFRRQLWEGLA